MPKNTVLNRRKKPLKPLKVPIAPKFLSIFEHGLPLTYLPKILFTTILIILYIGLSHYADRNVRSIRKLKNEVEDLNAEYRTIHSKFVQDQLQTSVAKSVKPFGLIENNVPPVKIERQDSEH